MGLPALQEPALTRLVGTLRQLAEHAEAPAAALEALAGPLEAGLWSEPAPGRLLAGAALVALGDRLPDLDEIPAAACALEPALRAAWLRLVLARLRGMGERGDVEGLAQAVTAAGPELAQELACSEAAPSLAPTPFTALERMLLPAPAHEAPAFPVLLRVLAATAGPNLAPAAALPVIEPEDPATAWCPGRLMRLPATAEGQPAAAVLGGALDDGDEGDTMRWVLRHPWAFLLAQMAFTQEAWAAERVSGALSFELERAHAALFQQPPRVEVVVMLPGGEEVHCGSLGEFTLRVLAQMGVAVLGHRITPARLDERLALVVQALLRREVWRFQPSAGGWRDGYAIHPLFSDACYRALGSRAFYRRGAFVTAAVRRVAQTWAGERVSRAAGAGGAPA